MSLLEDIFLGDEADEAQELERVIDGDEYDGRPRSTSPNSNENSEKEDEAEEDKRRVDPTQTKAKKVVKNPRFILNPARLTGPRGIQVIPDHFKDFKFKGKGHEKEDLDLVLKKLEHWAYRLYPKFQFEDCLKKIETLGKKRPVMVHLHKIRTDQFVDEPVVQKDSSDDDEPAQEEDEFDKLLQQQIELARATPAPNSVRKAHSPRERSPPSFTMPKATSSPSISDEQRDRMMKNRRLAEQRRLAKLNTLENSQTLEDGKLLSESQNDLSNTEVEIDVLKKHRTKIIDSSDEECDEQSHIAIEVHKDTNKFKKDGNNVSSIYIEVNNDSKVGCHEIETDISKIDVDNSGQKIQGSEASENIEETENDLELHSENDNHINISKDESPNNDNFMNSSNTIDKVDSKDDIENDSESNSIEVCEKVPENDKIKTNAIEVSEKVPENDKIKTNSIELSEKVLEGDKLIDTEVMDVDFTEDF